MSTCIKVRIKAYDHRLADACARQIVQTTHALGGAVRGPIPLPVKREPYQALLTVLGSEAPSGKVCVYGRILTLTHVTEETMQALANLPLPTGVRLTIDTLADVGAH